MADASVAVALKFVDQATAPMKHSLGSIEGMLARTGSMISGAFAGIGLAQLGKDILDTGMQFERMRNALVAVTGSMGEAGDEMKYIRSEAKRLGLELMSSSRAYTGLAASAKGTDLAGEATREIFTAVSEAMTVLGGTADQTQGALYAIGQMMSKGTVQAEELRGQLGERLPGAFNLAAKAMNVTTAELNALLQKGEVIASDFLPKFASVLRNEFAGGVERATTSLQASINRTTQEWDLLKQSLAETGAMSAAKAGLDLVSAGLQGTTWWINQAIGGWKTYKAFVNELAWGQPENAAMMARAAAGAHGGAYVDPHEERRIKMGQQNRLGALAAETKALKKKQDDEAAYWTGYQKQLDEGAKLWEKTQTPLEKYGDEIARVTKLYESGAITQELYARGMKSAKDELDRLDKKGGSGGSGAMGKPAINTWWEQQTREAESLYASVRTPEEIYREEIAKFDWFMNQKLITTETYGRLYAEADAKRWENNEELKAREKWFDDVKRDYEGLLDTIATPDEKYNKAIENLNRLWSGGMDQATYDRAVKHYRDQFKNTAGEMTEFAVEAAHNIQDALGDTMYDVLTGKFEDIGKSFSDMLARMASEYFASQIGKMLLGDYGSKGGSNAVGGLVGALGSMIVGYAGGGGSTSVGAGAAWHASIHHAGGIVGMGGPTRTLPAWMFAGAPRLHGGLAPDEYPAVLQRGETVLPRGQSAKPDVQVIINNKTGKDLRQEQTNVRFDGKRWIKEVVLELQQTDPSFRSAMQR